VARAKRKDDSGPPGAPAWMVTYGDLMSLLLTFFVLLLSFSSIEEEKFEHAVQSLQGALGVLPYNLTAVPSPLPPQDPGGRRPTRERIRQMARELMRFMQVRGFDTEVEMELSDQGVLKINLPSQVLFESGEAVLRPQAVPILTEVARQLGAVEGAVIEVHGHTDNVPVSTAAYADNWYLSFDRARTVMMFLVENGEIPFDRIEPTAHADSRPVASNDTPEGRQENRRVEIFVRGDIDEDVMRQLSEHADVSVPEEGGPRRTVPGDSLVPIEVPRRD